MYAGDMNLSDKYISPINGDFTGLKNVYISSCKDELICKSNIVLAQKMKEAGVNVQHDILDSGMHDVISMRGFFKESEDAWMKIIKYINNL